MTSQIIPGSSVFPGTGTSTGTGIGNGAGFGVGGGSNVVGGMGSRPAVMGTGFQPQATQLAASTSIGFPPGLSVHNTAGAILIASLLSVWLFGVALIQVIYYFGSLRSKKDPNWLRIIVAWIGILETAHTILVSHAVYMPLISEYGQMTLLVDAPWSAKADLILSTLVNATVQTYFTYRIRVLSSFVVVPAICITLIIARSAIGFTTCGLMLRMPLLQYTIRYQSLVVTNQIGGVITDIVVSGSLAWVIWRRRGGRSDRAVRGLVLFAIETGLLATVLEIVMLITFFTLTRTYIWGIFLTINSKTYANSLLFSLNTRDRIQATYNNRADQPWIAAGSANRPTDYIEIEVKKTTTIQGPNEKDVACEARSLARKNTGTKFFEVGVARDNRGVDLEKPIPTAL